MAPRKPAAQLRPAGAPPRRSARVQAKANHATPAFGGNNRVTKVKAAPKPKPPKYDCTTCDRTLAASSFPKYLSTDNCKHLINTCRSCLQEWISAQLDGTTYDKLSCPECLEIMQNSDVNIHATKEAYAKFDELERRDIAEKTPGWRWCLAPKCKAGQVHGSLLEVDQNATSSKTRKCKRVGKKKDIDNICVCNECGAKACVSCDRPAHEGITCAQNKRRLENQQNAKEEEASLNLIGKACKQCPKCNKNIERNGGCDHMTCSQCKTQFCWECTTTYDIVRTQGHAKGCRYAQPGRIDPHAMGPFLGGVFHGIWQGAFGGGGGGQAN